MQISSVSMFKAQNIGQNTRQNAVAQQYIQNAGDTFCKSTNNVAFKGNDNIGLLPEKITQLTRKEAIKQGYTCVYTAKELQKALNKNKKVCLMSDIKLDPNSENNWNPIAEFSNELNGNGFAITGLRINQPDKDRVGLFSYLLSDAKVENLILTDAKIAGKNAVGGLAGEIFDFSKAVNNHIEADVRGGNWVGGLAGHMKHAKAVNNHIEVNVKGDTTVGGLAGEIFDFSKAVNNHIEVNVTGDKTVGGLAGWMHDNAAAKNNHIEGYVKGDQNVGKLAGYHGDYITIKNNNTESVKVIIRE